MVYMNQNSNQINSFSLIVNLLLILISGILLIGFLTLGYLKNQNKDLQVIIELKENIDYESVENLILNLKQNPLINSNSIKYINRSEGLQWMTEQSETDLMNKDLPNPLSDIIIFSRNPEINNIDFNKIDAKLKQNSLVAHVIFPIHENDQLVAYQQITQRITGLFLAIALIIFYLALRIYIKLGYKLSKFRENEVNLTEGSYYKVFVKNVYTQVFWSNLMIISIFIFIYSYFFQNNSDWLNYFSWTYLIVLIATIFLSSMLLTFLATIFKKQR